MKPIYNIKRLTEHFGACGSGWGWTQPSFQVVEGDGELLVFCTVALWYVHRENLVYGVGGDKIVTKRKDGSFNNDEAFKAAYTDAQSNAMKMIGVGADIHMGLFEDDKYLSQLQEEFSEPAEPSPAAQYAERAAAEISKFDSIAQLDDWVQANLQHLNSLPTEDGKTLRGLYERRRTFLQAQENNARKPVQQRPQSDRSRELLDQTLDGDDLPW